MSFQWQVVQADVARATAQWRALASRLRAELGAEAASLVVTSGGGLRVLDASGEALDLSALSLDLLGELLTFFVLGQYSLDVVAVKAPYLKSGR